MWRRVYFNRTCAQKHRAEQRECWWGSWRCGTALVTAGQNAKSSTANHNFFFFFFLYFSFSPPGSHKHQRQTWVGSKCSLKKPTTLRNGRPNSSPWWRAKKLNLEQGHAFISQESGVLGNCHWATTVKQNCFFYARPQSQTAEFGCSQHKNIDRYIDR